MRTARGPSRQRAPFPHPGGCVPRRPPTPPWAAHLTRPGSHPGANPHPPLSPGPRRGPRQLRCLAAGDGTALPESMDALGVSGTGGPARGSRPKHLLDSPCSVLSCGWAGPGRSRAQAPRSASLRLGWTVTATGRRLEGTRERRASRGGLQGAS